MITLANNVEVIAALVTLQPSVNVLQSVTQQLILAMELASHVQPSVKLVSLLSYAHHVLTDTFYVTTLAQNLAQMDVTHVTNQTPQFVNVASQDILLHQTIYAFLISLAMTIKVVQSVLLLGLLLMDLVKSARLKSIVGNVQMVM